jgi:nucleoid-associated protein EbfC
MADDGGFKMPDLGNLMKMAQDMQSRVAEAQEELARKTCEASAGGGMVTVTMNGSSEIVAITIDPEVVDPKDVAMLQDLIVAAVNQAITKVKEMTRAEMSKLTGGLNIPGMPNLF